MIVPTSEYSDRLTVRSPVRFSPARIGMTLLLLLAAVGGCSRFNARLTVLSGPPVGPLKGRRGPPIYAVHVGETVQFRFQVNPGLFACDYALSKNLATNKYADCGPPDQGVFTWQQRFGQPTPPDRPIRIRVDGYMEVWRRDYLPINGELVPPEHRADQADELLGRDTIELRVYQAVFAFDVALSEAEPDWTSARLVIRGDDDRVLAMRGRRGPDGRGFSVSGPNAAGLWSVTYQPTPHEVRLEGRTRAVLEVADRTGRIHTFETVVDTP